MIYCVIVNIVIAGRILMRYFFKETKFLGFIMVVIVSIIANAFFLYILDDLGYFSWVFKCYGKTLELFCNVKNITFLNYWKVMLSDVAVIGSGLIVLFIVFDWIPNGIMDVLGYKRSRIAGEDIDNREKQ